MQRTVPFVLLVVVSVVLVLASCSGSPQGNPAAGERWFGLNRCDGCHGAGGSGGKGPPLAGTGLSFRRFLAKLRSPDSQIMPPFPPDRLSDQDAADIYLWLLAKQHANK